MTMTVASPGLLVVWNDITADDEAEFNAWYEEEHFPERLGVPGFLTARRYRDAAASSRYAAIYDTASLAVLASPAYLARLANPTPRTRAIMAHFRNMTRAACEIVADLGAGSAPGRTLAWLELDATRVDPAHASLAAAATAGRVRLAVPDAKTTQVPNPEAKFRETPDRLPPPFVLVEGDDAAAVRTAADRLARSLVSPQPARLFELMLAQEA
jgi:hypothetical protein